MVSGRKAYVSGLLLLLAAAACSAHAERLGDYNGDGKADVLLRHDDGSWRIHLMDGASAGPGVPVRMTSKLEFYWAGAGDFNGDGRDDVLLRRDDGVWLYYALDGSRVIREASGWANLTRNLDFRVVGVGDFNDDDRDDVLLRQPDGAWLYYPMDGRRVVAGEWGWANLPRDPDWRMAGTGDFDGDGRADALLRHAHEGTWRHYSMNGRRIVDALSTTTSLPRDMNWRFAGIGDFVGDGRDYALLRHLDGRWQYQAVEEASGVHVDLEPDWSWRLAGIADGDGSDDLLLRHDDGRWQWRRVAGDRVARGAAFTPTDADGWRIPTRPVFIPDTGLRKAVGDAVGKAQHESLRAREVAALTALRVERAGIRDLTGIGAATGLSKLDMSWNEIRSLRPLAGVAGLRELELFSNRVDDVSTLLYLPALEELTLGANGIEDIEDVAALTELTQLRGLSIQFNRITDVSPLVGLTELRQLNVEVNRLEDISPLASLTRLEVLDAAGNGVADIGPLRNLTGLTTLYLGDNAISDLSPLAGLTGLERLSLGGHALEDISPLSGLTGLTWLWISKSNVKDWSPLSGLTGLRSLGVPDNGIADISWLASMTTLGSLRLYGNEIHDIAPLANLTQLTYLSLSENRVSNVNALAGLTGLRTLWADDNRISDLRPLSGLTALSRLGLNNNEIEDISPLRHFTELWELWLRNNLIEDISPLAGLTHLNVLRLERNRVVDIAALEHLTNLDTLNLAYNRIADLSPLVNNPGLSDGDLVDVRGNPLSEESTATVVPTLVSRGVHVEAGTPARFELVHDDNVVVLHVEADLQTQDLYTGLPLDLYSTILYAHFEDAFDFVMFYSNLDDIDEHQHAHYYGVYSSVRNDTAGVGRGTFYDSRYGSRDKLKGVIHFPYNRALLSGPSLHEMLHAWANFTVPTAVGGHWGFSSAAGQLGGFELGNLVELGDSRYAAGRFGTFANGGNRPAYSPIELYFAGYIPPEEVPDLWVAADGKWVVEDGNFVRTDDGHAVFSADDVKTYSIEEIVAKNGARVPSMADAQWHFRVAVVLLTDDDHPATTEQLDLLSQHAAWFSRPANDEYYLHNFFEATGGRGSVTMGGLSQFRRAAPAAVVDLPPSFGVVPEPRATLIDGRCLPMSAIPLTVSERPGNRQALFVGE